MSPIRKGSPRARSRGLRLALIIFILGLLAMVLFLAQQEALVTWLFNHVDILLANSWLVFVFMLVLMSPLIAFGGYLVHIANRVLASGEFPPPGLEVARDTPVFHGEDAVKRARLIQVMGVLLIVAAMGAGVLLQQAVVGLLLQAG